jgi:hypothetical protein
MAGARAGPDMRSVWLGKTLAWLDSVVRVTPHTLERRHKGCPVRVE